jgi:hypothetical protein
MRIEIIVEIEEEDEGEEDTSLQTSAALQLRFPFFWVVSPRQIVAT